MSDYDTDILTWSEHQANLLRRRAAGELVNDADLDWSNIAEEIEDVGSNRLHAVESLLIQALRRMLKAEAWPLSLDAPNWRPDAIDFRRQTRRRFVPSMRQKINVADLYADALAAVPDAVNGQPPLPVPDVCRWTLDGDRRRAVTPIHRADPSYRMALGSTRCSSRPTCLPTGWSLVRERRRIGRSLHRRSRNVPRISQGHQIPALLYQRFGSLLPKHRDRHSSEFHL
jgi:hypothetical protein